MASTRLIVRLALLLHAVAWATPADAQEALPADEFDQMFAEAIGPVEQGDDVSHSCPAESRSGALPAADSAAIYDSAIAFDEPLWRPFDFLRDWGFRHSSTHGRHVGRGVPLERSSWLNRLYHVDWFLGPLLSDDLDSGRVGQSDAVFGGLRVGWDFDYYWGIQWRIGWADPEVQTSDNGSPPGSGSLLASDVDVVYYPWGDVKVRPFMLLGLGLAEVDTVAIDGAGQQATLLGMPFGGGVVFHQTPWLAWRLEVLDNVAFGGDGVSTMHNVSFTAGMDIRLGARPRSYWPWRSSRKIW